MSDNFFEDAEIISSYIADQAVEDGTLVDVSEMAKEAGFTIPVRITRTVHDLCEPPKSNKIQSYSGRLWDVLWMALNAIRRATDESMTTFTVKIGKRNHEMWATLDHTSGPAIHIIKPEDY